MANWYGASRSNYFKVKDVAAFKEAMSNYEVNVWDADDEGFALGAATEDGSWPSYDSANDEYIDFEDVVAPHLADGEVCVFMSAGHEKLRYITGNAIAFINTGEYVALSLGHIYQMAQDKFGVAPTTAEF